ncbi:unnamed protein product [Rodentolepis nana]|uniref:Uncharacterized protein n=1 Tax=Rodentolepis nana TaxID=102285 RepID=A0A3P7V2W4_RODNA|nr:unnamed protein product [Rodentolepis nana]
MEAHSYVLLDVYLILLWSCTTLAAIEVKLHLLDHVLMIRAVGVGIFVSDSVTKIMMHWLQISKTLESRFWDRYLTSCRILHDFFVFSSRPKSYLISQLWTQKPWLASQKHNTFNVYGFNSSPI